MSPAVISSIAFACVCAGVLLGFILRFSLPEHHLSDSSKDAVKLGTGTIATLAALVLGLLIGSAKGTFDAMSAELTQTGARIALLDRTLARYGPETAEARGLLYRAAVTGINHIWPEDTRVPHTLPAAVDDVRDKLLELSPRDDAQRWLQSNALQIINDVAQARWLLLEQRGQTSIPVPFLAILVFWLTVIFVSFSLFSPPNATVITVLLLCALSVSGAIFLILELDRPAQGLIKLSDAPLRSILLQLGH